MAILWQVEVRDRARVGVRARARDRVRARVGVRGSGWGSGSACMRGNTHVDVVHVPTERRARQPAGGRAVGVGVAEGPPG